jgi:hypothetical protein
LISCTYQELFELANRTQKKPIKRLEKEEIVNLKMNNKPEMKRQEWYEINHPEKIDSPALLIFKHR